MNEKATDPRAPMNQALGRIPSGLFILTVRRGAEETGMLASWVQQCSFEPPQISVAVNHDRYLLEWLECDKPFTINVLADGQTHLVKHFGRGFEPGEDAFQGLSVFRNGESAAILKEAHAYLDCRVVSRAEAGDHVLVIGRVAAGAVQGETPPAIHVRKNGLNY